MKPKHGAPGADLPIAEGVWNGRLIRFRPDRIVVGLYGPTDVAATPVHQQICEEIARSIPEARVLRFPRRSRVAVIEVPQGSDIPTLAKAIAERPDVRYAEPDMIGEISLTPDDSRFVDQWGPHTINAEEAWALETGSADVLIGIIDTGIATNDSGALNHPDLDDAARYTLGTDFVNSDAVPRDDHGHGTHVVGIAAAETDNATGVAGMDWASPVYICKVFDSAGTGATSDVEAAVQEIVDHAVAHNLHAVINLSAGWTSPANALRDAARYAHDHGMVLCACTHNDSGPVRWPAVHSVDFAGVIAVGATNSSDSVSGFSNTGPEVTVVAPGEGVLSTMPPYDVTSTADGYAHDYDRMDGTSMATPHVTGLAALVWARETRLSNEQVRDVLANTAVKLGAGTFDNAWGHGRVDAEQAVLKAGWEVSLVTPALHFLDVPEGETTVRAVRFDVRSFHRTTFEIVTGPSAPFDAPFATSVTLGKTTDYDTPRDAYLWVSYTGTTDGATASGTVRVRCVDTEEEWDVPITANTIARPSACIMLVLDRSNSMSFDSGVLGRTRVDLLRYSANILADVLREGNGLGIVSFDEDAHDVLIPVAGPVGAAEDFFDPPRTQIRSALTGFDFNPAGWTSIGDGVQRAHDRLGDVTGYDVEATLVFTDGHENRPASIASVAAAIDERVFAVGLGTAQVIQPNALNELTNGTGGYTVLTDVLDDDDQFKLAKYFLQIQAGISNEDVVVDPTDWIGPGQKVEIPFRLVESDISTDVICLLPAQGIVRLSVEAPDGSLITEATAMASPSVTYAAGRNVSFYRFTLPQPVAGGEVHAGVWRAVLEVDKGHFDRYLKTLEDPTAIEQALAHGVPYTLLVHAYSNLRLRAGLAQGGYEPGAALTLTATLTEFGAPLLGSASVRAVLTRPDGSTQTLVLAETAPGVFSVTTTAVQVGVHAFHVRAEGFTARHSRFTREQLLTGFVWRGGDRPDDPVAEGDPTRELVCQLLACLVRNTSDELREEWAARGFDVRGLLRCFCERKEVQRAVLTHREG